jgi:hypothetical protein
VALTRYSGSGGGVRILQTISGKPVTGIGDRTFFGYSSLTSVTIPKNVILIGEGAFTDCSSLKPNIRVDLKIEKRCGVF